METWLPTLFSSYIILSALPVRQVRDALFTIVPTNVLEYSLQSSEWITCSPLNQSLRYNALIAQAQVTWVLKVLPFNQPHPKYRECE